MIRQIFSLHLLVYALLHLISFQSVAQSHEQELEDKIASTNDEQEKFDLLVELGTLYLNKDLQKADSLKFMILEASKPLGDNYKFKALIHLSELERILGFYTESDRYILASQQFMNTITEDNKLILLNKLSTYHFNQKEFAVAQHYLNEFRKNEQKNTPNRIKVLFHLNNAQYFMHLNNKDSSLFYVKKAIDYARQTKEKSILSNCFGWQGKIYSTFNQLDLGVAKNIVALQLAQEAGDKILISNFNRELGSAQFLLNNLKDAKYYLNKAIQNANSINSIYQRGLAEIELSKVELGLGNLDSARELLEKSKTIFEFSENNNSNAEIQATYGALHKLEEKYNASIQSYNLALILYESTGNKTKIANVYEKIGEVFKQTKKYTKALNYLERSIEIRNQINLKSQVYSTYRSISDIYKELGNPTKSLEYLNLYINYIDSNSTAQAAAKIVELNERYRSEQREKLIMAQKDSLQMESQEKKLTAAKLENSQLRNNFYTYILIGLIVTAIFTAFMLRNRWKREHIEQQQRESELAQSLLRTQMNPHFVFNAMSVIQSYIYDNDTVNSSKFLVNFSRLMRLILENSPKQFISIEVEVDILEKYLQVQSMRFHDRFVYEIIVDPILHEEKALIPPMITQPFIENAIEHGQLHTLEHGFIEVVFHKKGGMLEVIITDNGIGIENSKNTQKSMAHKSMAMQITKDRIYNLNKRYKSEGELTIEDYDKKNRTGTKITLSLPYHNLLE